MAHRSSFSTACWRIAALAEMLDLGLRFPEHGLGQRHVRTDLSAGARWVPPMRLAASARAAPPNMRGRLLERAARDQVLVPDFRDKSE